ncbi:MAG TPA: hypothetical protein V6C89_13460 [Drouetiella sp.]|jgi:hypothetical protein
MIRSILSKTSQRIATGASVLAIACTLPMPGAFAQDESGVGYYSNGYRPIQNNDFLGLAHNTPETYLFRAEVAINREQWAQAIKYLRKSMKGNDDDIDTHKYLAICLEKQMDEQTDRDPGMFKECVKEWLIVLRNTKGAEKGLTFKNGLSPTNNKKWEDEQTAGMARHHLKELTGQEPKRWETNDKFIARVAKPAEESVQAKVLSKKPAALQSGVDQ